MPTTFAERQTEAETLMQAGLGVTAIPLVDRDILLVKDPTYHTPDDPTTVKVWVEHAGGTTLAAYGLE